MSGGRRHPPGFDALIGQAYRDGLSYDEICLAHGLSVDAARSIVGRLIRHGAIVKRMTDKERRAEMMRANSNNHWSNQVFENDGRGRDRTKIPMLGWSEIDALYAGRQYEDVVFR